MSQGTAFAVYNDQRRFSDEMFDAYERTPARPCKDTSPLERCPFCEQQLPHARTTVLSVLLGGIQRLFVALCMIVGGVLRFARLVVAGVLCLIGLIGASSRAIGIKIAHPHDRRLFQRSRTQS